MNQTQKIMIKEARQMLQFAYAPYSNFTVGACICSEDDMLFTGANVENSAFGLTVCAETSAICQMIGAGHQKIKSIAIVSGANELCSPCGGCRQRIHEFSTPKTQIFLCNKDTILQTLTIDELLPMAFSLKSTRG